MFSDGHPILLGGCAVLVVRDFPPGLRYKGSLLPHLIRQNNNCILLALRKTTTRTTAEPRQECRDQLHLYSP
jgi:hypothetical protein